MAVDVLFVGGGVIGLAAAWEAARSGLRVCVADPSPGRGASWVAAGMIAPVTEAHFGEEDLLRLLVAGSELWPDFAASLTEETGIDVGYRRCGTIVVARDASDRAVIEELLGYQHSLGLVAVRRSSSDCRALVPALSPAIRGGAEVPGDHQVDNRRLVDALLDACRRASVELLREPVVSVETGPDGGVRGVRTQTGRTKGASTVVVCAGCESTRIAGVPRGVLPPVRPVKGHILRLRGAPQSPLIDRTVRGLVRGRACYVVPRADGTVVVGATVEERGFDRAIQAGAVRELLDDARSLVPGIEELELAECQTGLRPGSPDNAPYVGWTHVPRLAVATGHYRNGILLAPLTAEALLAALNDRPLPPELGPFDATRASVATSAVTHRSVPGAQSDAIGSSPVRSVP